MTVKTVLFGLLLSLSAYTASAQDHTATVSDVKAALVARGVNLAGPCGAFQMTGRVAFILRNDGWGLIAKNPGNNGCDVSGQGRFAVDALANRITGQWVDLLINSETENIPAWQLHEGTPDSFWRAPFEMDGPAPPLPPTPPVPPTPPTPPPPAPVPSSIQDSLNRIEAEVILVKVSLAEHRGALQRMLVRVLKYAGPAVGTWLTMLLK